MHQSIQISIHCIISRKKLLVDPRRGHPRRSHRKGWTLQQFLCTSIHYWMYLRTGNSQHHRKRITPVWCQNTAGTKHAFTQVPIIKLKQVQQVKKTLQLTDPASWLSAATRRRRWASLCDCWWKLLRPVCWCRWADRPPLIPPPGPQAAADGDAATTNPRHHAPSWWWERGRVQRRKVSTFTPVGYRVPEYFHSLLLNTVLFPAIIWQL